MSKQFWIRTRLFGWVVMLLWFIFYEVNLFFNLCNHQFVNAMNGLFGAIGTFAVLVGYYQLIKEEM